MITFVISFTESDNDIFNNPIRIDSHITISLDIGEQNQTFTPREIDFIIRAIFFVWVTTGIRAQTREMLLRILNIIENIDIEDLSSSETSDSDG